MDPFESDAEVLISSFGIGAAVLTAAIALIPFRAGQRWPGTALSEAGLRRLRGGWRPRHQRTRTPAR
jgi:hypothetical protein